MCYGWCEKRDNDSDKAVCVSNPWNVCVIECCSVTGLYVRCGSQLVVTPV